MKPCNFFCHWTIYLNLETMNKYNKWLAWTTSVSCFWIHFSCFSCVFCNTSHLHILFSSLLFMEPLRHQMGALIPIHLHLSKTNSTTTMSTMRLRFGTYFKQAIHMPLHHISMFLKFSGRDQKKDIGVNLLPKMQFLSPSVPMATRRCPSLRFKQCPWHETIHFLLWDTNPFACRIWKPCYLL